MRPMQKHAWYNIAIVTLAVLITAGLHPFLGVKAFSGFWILALLSLGTLFYRSHPPGLAIDERDKHISHHALRIALWVAGITDLVLLSYSFSYYGDDGAISVLVVQFALVSTAILFILTHSIFVLLQYARGR